jgi:hypothetical protein
MIATAVLTGLVGVTMSSSAALAQAPEEGPQLVLEPEVVQPGDSLVVSGSCGPDAAGQSIQVVLTGELSGQLVRVETDATTGGFDADAEIPPQSPTGTSTVVAACGFGEDDPAAQLIVSEESTDRMPPAASRVVERGDVGERVAWWQDRLNEWLALEGSDLHPIAVDGIFGPETEAATIEFQETVERLDPDGVVGPRDRVDLEAAIDDAMGRDDEVDPVGDFGTAAVESGAFPELGEIALLEEIRTGTHQAFERITFEFASGDLEYRVRYVDEPPTDPAGEPVDVEGSEILEIHISGAAGVDLTGEEAEETYEGPRRFSPEALAVVRELALVEDFEGNLRWVVGLGSQTPFAVDELSDPLRLVVDVQTP